MKILITGICGFVGSRVALALQDRIEAIEIAGIDNLLRPGSETNRMLLQARGIMFIHGDVRIRSDVDALPPAHWVIDAAANPSVLAGVDGRSSPRQLAEHNLSGTLNLLEYCRERDAGLILLSTNRVYSVSELATLPLTEHGNAFALDTSKRLPCGASEQGIAEDFSVHQPVSLYGATKLASEIMAFEYGSAFKFPVWVNRCGVIAGAGQFGTAEQGIFSYWVHAHAARLPLRYLGFGGRGYQVRDALHPDDVAELIRIQLQHDPLRNTILNAGGGRANAMSLAQLTAWCDERFGQHAPTADTRDRPYDVPWMVMDSSRAFRELGWQPERSLDSILDEIATHACQHPDWLRRTGAV